MSPSTRTLPHVSSRTLRNRLGTTLRLVSRDKERIVLQDSRGKEVAVIVPLDDMALIREMEDRIDTQAADQSLAEMKAKGEKPIPYEQVRRELGL